MKIYRIKYPIIKPLAVQRLVLVCTGLSSMLVFGACPCNKPKPKPKPKPKTETPSSESKTVKRAKTPSGLEYEIVQEGSGASPTTGKKITVHYTGWLNEAGQTGKKFDSSVDRARPFTFVIGVGQVIPGWDEGVMSMKVGEKRRLYIPAALGYGSRGAGAAIPPNADLIFDVELISID